MGFVAGSVVTGCVRVCVCVCCNRRRRCKLWQPPKRSLAATLLSRIYLMYVCPGAGCDAMALCSTYACACVWLSSVSPTV